MTIFTVTEKRSYQHLYHYRIIYVLVMSRIRTYLLTDCALFFLLQSLVLGNLRMMCDVWQWNLYFIAHNIHNTSEIYNMRGNIGKLDRLQPLKDTSRESTQLSRDSSYLSQRERTFFNLREPTLLVCLVCFI